MVSSRRFFRTVFTLEVLSEDSAVADIDDLFELVQAITTGDCSGTVAVSEVVELDGPQAASALISQASDPGFFLLDEYGNDLYEDDDEDEAENTAAEGNEVV